MERYNSRGIDDVGRVALPGDLRHKLGLNEKYKLLLNPIGTIAVLLKTEDKPGAGKLVCILDQLGRIEIPRDVMQTLGWKITNKLAVYGTGNEIILMLDENQT